MNSRITIPILAANWVPITKDDTPIYTLFPKIKNFLALQENERIINLLAEPIEVKFFDGKTSLIYSISGFETMPVSLPLLPEEQKQEAIEIFTQQANAFKAYCNTLLSSINESERYWGDLLLKCAEIPDDSAIYFSYGKVVLLGWGFKNETNQVLDTSLLFNLPNSEKENSFIEDINSENQKNINIPAANQSIKNSPKRENTESSSKNDSIGNPPKEQVKEGKKRRIFMFGSISLLLLLILLVFFLLDKCNNKSYLPAKEGVLLPVQQITKDPFNGLIMVANDRINIQLSDEKDIDVFARAFSQKYQNKQYEIVYYNRVIKRIQIKVPPEALKETFDQLKNEIKDIRFDVFLEPVYQTEGIPNDNGFSSRTNSWFYYAINAPKAWDISTGDSNLIVAVIDDGFDLRHEEFKGKVLDYYNATENNRRVYFDEKKKLGMHGTHVAGLIMANANNYTAFSGISPKCRLMAIQTGNTGGGMSFTAVEQGFIYAVKNGANVINMSLGMYFDKSVHLLPVDEQRALVKRTFKMEEMIWTRYFKDAYDKGIAVVLASGNEDLFIGLDPMSRTPYTINVTATNPLNKKADFSNFGENATISAPGVDIFSTIPNNKVAPLSGTSMASPIVAGAVVLIKAINPNYSIRNIIDCLQTTGLPINSPNKYVGNLLQLDAALKKAKNDQKLTTPLNNCDEIQEKIDSLKRLIEQLKMECEEAQRSTDTLTVPPGGTVNAGALAGTWQSSEYIYNNKGEKVILQFAFSNVAGGKIILREFNGTECDANFTAVFSAASFTINQTSNFTCNPSGTYQNYNFSCNPDATGNYRCHAQNTQESVNNFNFYLVKVKP